MPHSKFQIGGVLSLATIFCAAQGLTGALPGNATLAPSGTAIPTTTLADGRTAWRFAAAATSQLASGSLTTANVNGVASMCRFVYRGYNSGQSDGRVVSFGNLFILSVTGGKVAVAAINGQTINWIGSGPSLVIGTEYCVIALIDPSTSTATLYLDGVSIATAALTSWTANATVGTTVTVGDATGRVAADVIEFGMYLSSASVSPLSTAQVASVSGGGYFLDILRPTHPPTSPMTYTTSILGGRLTDVHAFGLRRTSNPISDAGSIVASGSRTGPGTVVLADSATDTGGRRFYRVEVSSTGSVSMTSTNYGSGAPGGYVLGCAPVPTPPTAAAFSPVPSCPAMGGVADSRGLPQSNNNGPYRILRGDTSNFVGIVAPGAGWKHYNGTPYSGTLYKADGTTQTLTNTDLMTAYLAEAAAAGITVTNFGPLGVNDWAIPGTDTTLRGDISGAITRARNAGHKVIITQEIGNEFSPQSQANLISQSAYIATLADGVNIIQSDDAYQRFNAAYLDMVSLDGTHSYGTGALNPSGNPINGMTAAQITANYNFLAIQTAILPGVLLSINNAVGTVEPGKTLTRTLTIRPVNGFTGPCTLSVSGLPTGVTSTFSPTSPLTISSSAAVTVTMTLSAAADAPLMSNPTTVTITASAATSAPTVALSLQVIDVTNPIITDVVIDTNGTSVTITLDSVVTGNTGISIFENGSFRLLGTLTNLNGFNLTGSLSTAIASGSSVVTWSYNSAIGNLVDAGGNEVPTSSGTADNNTGGGGGSIGLGVVVLSGPSTITPIDAGVDGTIGLFVGDRYGLMLRATVGGQSPGGAGATWSIQTTDEATGTAITSNASPTMVSEDLGFMSYSLAAADTASARRVRLTAKRTLGSDVRIFGPLVMVVRDR